MNKRHLHHILVQLRKVRVLYFVIPILISGFIAVSALRQNNITAINLRDQVLQVDKENGDVEAALRTLREHVYSHMNSNLAVPGGAYPPVQLKYRYERLVEAEKGRVTNANAALYTEAQKYCEALIPDGRSLGRIDCIQNYITSRGAVTEQSVNDSLYKFDFTPPLWSPDLAGWSLLLTSVLTLAFIIRTVTVQCLKHSTRKRHN